MEDLEIETDGFITGIKAKVENKGQYDQYLEELKPLREELGVSLKEDLYPEEAK
jgi:cytochrome c oxidase subunit 5a